VADVSGVFLAAGGAVVAAFPEGSAMSTRVTPSSRFLSLVAASVLAACSGTGPAGPTPAPVVTPDPTPPAAPTPTPSPPPGPVASGAPVIAGVAPAAGPESGGNLVTITGTGFGVRPQVLFGSLVARVATVPAPTDTSVTVIAPKENPGLVSLVVTNQDGLFAVAPLAYRYDPATGG
jgi:hypothetical protein